MDKMEISIENLQTVTDIGMEYVELYGIHLVDYIQVKML